MTDIEKGDIGTHSRYAPRPSTLGNPATLGLFSFASTTFIFSFYEVAVDGINIPNVVVGMALFCGGLAQLLAGMWEFPRGNTFGATAFTLYGAFWLSFATILIPGSGIFGAFETAPAKELNAALGIYLFSWFIVTFLFFIVSLRKSIAFIVLFGCLSMTFLLAGAGKFNTTPAITTAGGAFGIVTAFIAYYIGLADLLTAEKAAIVGLPLGAFKHD
ncbi:FUN34 transmembrane protein [Mycena galopus ATCC 62051]|nr:FUN34 transmembrane protein [Mycena galopus ATCC 62051]